MDLNGKLLPMTLLNDLKAQVVSKHLVAVVGAGVSAATAQDQEAATWQGLLRHGVRRCVDLSPRLTHDWEQKRYAEIDSREIPVLLSAAEQVQQTLKELGGEFQRWLRESVGALKATDTSVIKALAALDVPLLTTNYDSLLEDVTGRMAITWRQPNEIVSWLRGEQKTILHLHGLWQDHHSVILGVRDYEIILAHEQTKMVLQMLRTTKSFLFVGCGAGLADPNFSAHLSWARAALSTSEIRHFRLSRNADVETLRADHPATDRIYVLGYGPDYKDLPGFLVAINPGPDQADFMPDPKGPRGPSIEQARAPASRIPPISQSTGRPAPRLEITVTPTFQGLALGLRNRDLDPVRNCKITLDRWDLYSPEHQDFTRNSFEAFIALKSKEVAGLSHCSNPNLFVEYGDRKREIGLRAQGLVSGRRGPLPILRYAGVWRAQFSLSVGEELLRTEDHYFRWSPSETVEEIPDPRQSVVQITPEAEQREWWNQSAIRAIESLESAGHSYYRRIDMWVSGMEKSTNDLRAALRAAALTRAHPFPVSILQTECMQTGPSVRSLTADGVRYELNESFPRRYEYVETRRDTRVLLIETERFGPSTEFPYDTAIETTFDALTFWARFYEHLLGGGNTISIAITWAGLRGKVMTVGDPNTPSWIVRQQNKTCMISEPITTPTITSTGAMARGLLTAHAEQLTSYLFSAFDFPVQTAIYPLLLSRWKNEH